MWKSVLSIIGRPSAGDSPVVAPRVPLLARVLASVGRTLIISGLVVLLFVVFQLWGTNIQEARAQGDLRDEFDDLFEDAQAQLTAAPPDATVDAGDDDTPQESADDSIEDSAAADLPETTPTLPGGYDPEVLAYFFPEGGDAVARMEIPAIDVNKIVVAGVQVEDLRKGPGHYSDTPQLGNAGNSAVAGHRTTYGAPFNRIDELVPGDEIRVTSLLGEFTYRVMAPAEAFPEQLHSVDGQGDGHIIVRPGDTWVLGDFRDNRITLTACHPKLSSRQRIVVAAQLVEEPVVLPDWAETAVAAVLAGENPTVPVLAADQTATGPVATDDPVEFEFQAPETSSLDEGLNGDRGAIPGATVWMLIAIAFWMVGGLAGRRWGADLLQRVGFRFIGLVPAAVCLWYSFEMIDRALPAG